MPRYYFHIINGDGETRDEEGMDLPDLDSARLEALYGIRSILQDELGRGRLDFGGVVHISDGDDRILLDVPFQSAVELRNLGSTG